jgi:hypothetical protein
MSETRKQVVPYQVRGRELDSASANANMVFELGPRYKRPHDDTTVMRVFHRTIDGDVSVLLEREHIPVVAAWLARTAPPSETGGPPDTGPQPDGSYQEPTIYYRQTVVNDGLMVIRDLQTTATLRRHGGQVSVSIAWNGSGRSVGVRLDAGQVADTIAWLEHADAFGWDGWKSGVTP